MDTRSYRKPFGFPPSCLGSLQLPSKLRLSSGHLTGVESCTPPTLSASLADNYNQVAISSGQAKPSAGIPEAGADPAGTWHTLDSELVLARKPEAAEKRLMWRMSTRGRRATSSCLLTGWHVLHLAHLKPSEAGSCSGAVKWARQSCSHWAKNRSSTPPQAGPGSLGLSYCLSERVLETLKSRINGQHLTAWSLIQTATHCSSLLDVDTRQSAYSFDRQAPDESLEGTHYQSSNSR